MKKLVILISGRGSNLQALLEAKLPCRIAAVISNRADAKGLAIAKAQNIPAVVVDHRSHADRESFDTALAQAIDAFDPDFVALAGFMRILGADFVSRYRGRLINIHPSLLPADEGVLVHLLQETMPECVVFVICGPDRLASDVAVDVISVHQ